MPLFIAPRPMVFNGKLREIINLEKIASFTFLKSVGSNYGYIRFNFDKNDHIWVYPDDASLLQDVRKICQLLNLPGEDITS